MLNPLVVTVTANRSTAPTAMSRSEVPSVISYLLFGSAGLTAARWNPFAAPRVLPAGGGAYAPVDGCATCRLTEGEAPASANRRAASPAVRPCGRRWRNGRRQGG